MTHYPSKNRHPVSWEEFGWLVDHLALDLRELLKQDLFYPNPRWCVGPRRSGLLLAALLSYRLGPEVGCLEPDAPTGALLPRNGGTMIWVDDIVDRGATMRKALDHATRLPGVTVIFASLFRKADSPMPPSGIPLLTVATVPQDTWVEFPYEREVSKWDHRYGFQRRP